MIWSRGVRRRNSSDIDADVQSIFSILPPAVADRAFGAAVGDYQSGVELFSSEMCWVEQASDGSVRRLVVTNLADLSSRIVERTSNASLDFLVGRLSRRVPGSGEIGYEPNGPHIFWTFGGIGMSDDRITIAVPLSLFATLIDIFNADSNLSATEKRVLFDLIGGNSVRQSALHSDVSVETRRAQVKSACAKLGCSGQTDVVRMILGQLAHLQQICDKARFFDAKGEQFRSDFLPQGVRFCVRPSRHGTNLRWYEYGPRDGKPVLAVHGMMLPLIMLGSEEHLDRLGIRLIQPVRRGYLEPIDPQSLMREDPLVSDSIADLAEMVELVSDRPVPVVGHSFGSLIAMRFAAARPDLVEQLHLCSINLGQESDENRNFIGRLFAGLRNLANRPGILRVIAGYYRQAYADERTVERVLNRMFERSASDIAYMAGRLGDDGAIWTWFSDLYQSSILGISEDFRFVLLNEASEFDVQCPVVFHHGGQDSVSPLAGVELLRDALPQATLAVYEGGHLICATHSDRIWGAIGASMSRDAEAVTTTAV